MVVFPRTLDDLEADTDHDAILRRVDDWETRVRALYRQLSAWLPAGWHTDESQTVVMREPMMAASGMAMRHLPVLNVYDEAAWKAKLIPHGLWVIGANGRIDLLAGRAKLLIIDVSEVFATPSWQLLDPAYVRPGEPLTQDAWMAAIGP